MRRTISLGLLLILIAPAGCATLNAHDDMARRTLYLDAHPALPAAMRDAIESGRLLTGMSRDMVTAAVGWPDQRSAVESPGAVMERWVYGDARYDAVVTSLYFAGEALVACEQEEVPTLALAQGRLALTARDPGGTRTDLAVAGMK